MKRILVFASGTRTGGGSGFQNLVEHSQGGLLHKAEIIGVVSNHTEGGVHSRAQKLEVPFYYFPKPREADDYRRLCALTKPDIVVLSGWLHFVVGIRDVLVVNIHPGKLPDTRGLHGLEVHERAIELRRENHRYKTAVTLHVVPYQEERDPAAYDTGEIIFEMEIEIYPDDTVEILQSRINRYEHMIQPYVISLILKGEISWDPAKNKLKVPPGYRAMYLPYLR